MRIAYLTSQYPAPSHTFIRREVSALRRLGVEIQTFSVRGAAPGELVSASDRHEASQTFVLLKQPAVTYVRDHGREALRNPSRYARTLLLAMRHRPPGAKALFLALAHFAEAIVMAAEMRRRGITHLHNHFANSGATVGLLASRHLSTGWSFTIHGISEFDYPAGLLLGRKIEAADFAACVSYFGRAQAYRLVDDSQWRKLSIVRCGLELDALPQGSIEAGGRLRLIVVGRLSAEKGIAGLLEALALLPPTQRPELAIVGDGPLHSQLEARVQELELRSLVTFLGRLPEAATLAAIAERDVLVLPSFMEGLPVVLMEAMALGKPVIATRVAGIPELVTDGETGLLFAPSDWNELAEKLTRIIGDPALRQRLAAAGKARVVAEFDVNLAADRLQQLFTRVARFDSSPSEHPNVQASGTSGSSTAGRVAGGSAPRG